MLLNVYAFLLLQIYISYTANVVKIYISYTRTWFYNCVSSTLSAYFLAFGGLYLGRGLFVIHNYLCISVFWFYCKLLGTRIQFISISSREERKICICQTLAHRCAWKIICAHVKKIYENVFEISCTFVPYYNSRF